MQIKFRPINTFFFYEKRFINIYFFKIIKIVLFIFNRTMSPFFIVAFLFFFCINSFHFFFLCHTIKKNVCFPK
ncbi:hypothetical protein BDF21DRAFT_23963 [Thamnidium elegans]|nr:hypothetical protein BDF21DRAFT_23963 [Thamnidium elegans]